VLSYSNRIRAPIANPPSNAQLEGTPIRDGHETSLAETETRPRRWPHQPRRDRNETFAGLETWPRRWNARCH